MSKSVNKPLECHLIYHEKSNGSQEIVLSIVKKITKSGKEKYALSNISIKTKTGVKKLENYIEGLQKENPDLKVEFWTKKEFKKNKELKKVMHRQILKQTECSFISSAIVVFIYLYISSIGFDMGNIFFLFESVFYTYWSVRYFLQNNHYVKQFYPKLKVSMYLFELLYACFLSMCCGSLYQEKRNLGINATAQVVTEVGEDSLFRDVETTEEKIDLLFDTLQNNSNITEEESEFFQLFRSYYEKNPYLDYDKVNSRYQELDIASDLSLPGYVAGTAFPGFFSSQINIDSDASWSTVYHEILHLNGRLPYAFLNEGMTDWLTEEFCPYESSDSADCYSHAGLFVRMLSEILGSDACLHAYSDESMGAINDALLQIIPDREALSNLYCKLKTVDSYFLLLRYTYFFDHPNGDKIRSMLYSDYIHSYEELFEALSPYAEQQLGISLKGESLMSGDHVCQQYASIILGYEPEIKEKKLKRYFNP